MNRILITGAAGKIGNTLREGLRGRYAVLRLSDIAPLDPACAGGLTANVRATVRTALETHLRHEPKKTSRSRVKRLRGLLRPQYRLRVDEVRVFYDVSGMTVEVLAIVPKSEAPSHGSHNSEIGNEGSSFIRDQG